LQHSLANIFQNLKLLEAEFPNKELIYIEDAVQFIENIVKTGVKQIYIKDYLKQKGYKRIEEKPPTIMSSTPYEDEDDFDLDDFLESNQGASINVQYPMNKSRSFKFNTKMIQDFNSSMDEKVYSDIVTTNLRLVHKEAKKLENWMKHKLSYDDLVQEGIFGLMKAIKRFDPSLGNQFSTYAIWWIRQAIFRAICDKGSTVRIPVHMIEQVNKLRKVEQQSMINENKINKKFVCNTLDITVEKYEQLKIIENNYFKITSLNGIVSEDEGDTELIEFISNDHAEVLGIEISEFNDPLLVAEKNDSINKLYSSLGELKEKERDIIMYRYGLIDGQEKTLEEVGRLFGVTRERIRQIEKKAMGRLRHKIRRKDWA
jgi:RNA polymerase primary sigma factor